MKLKRLFSMLLAAIMCVATVTAAMPMNLGLEVKAASDEMRINYIDNGDFEEKTEETKMEGFLNFVTYHYFTSWTAEWTGENPDNYKYLNQYEYRVGEGENAHGGNYALRVNSKEDTVYQMVEVPAGVTYELTGYVKLREDNGSARFGIIGYNKNEIADEYRTFSDTNIRFEDYATIDGLELENDTLVRGDWMKFTYTVDAPQDTNYLYVFFQGLSGAVYYDDISLCAVFSDVLEKDSSSGLYAVAPLSRYEISGNILGNSRDVTVKWEGYREQEINSDYATSNDEINLSTNHVDLKLDDSGYFSWMIETDEDTNYLAVDSTEGSIANMTVRKVQEPDRLTVLLNSNSYYTTEETGIATLTPDTTAYPDTTGWTGLCQVLQGENVIWSQENVNLSNGEVKLPFPITDCSGKDYIFKTTLYINGIEKETKEWAFARCYDRPVVLSEEGIFIDENDDVFHPVFAYHMLDANDKFLPVVDDCVDRLGVNLFQFGKGYVQEANWETAIKHLDHLASKGAKAIVCLYPGNKIASDPANKDLVSRYIKKICYHDAIFAWGVEDEPAGKATSEELLREAYEMVRELDVKQRPVYTVDQRESYYPKLIRNADVVAIDNYPYGRRDAMTYIYDSAKYAVETAAISNKPVYTLLQCFERYHGDFMDPTLIEDETRLYMPSANAIRNMIYQSLMAGTKGFGYYGFDYGPGMDEDGNNFETGGYQYTPPNVRTDSDLVKGIEEYAAKEQDLMFEYFVEGKYPTFNANYDVNSENTKGMRYVSFLKDGKIYMVILNKEEYKEQNVSVPLTGKDANGEAVTITGFTAVAYAGNGVLNANGTTEFMTDSVESDGSTLDVTLQPGAAVVYTITPNKSVTSVTLNKEVLSLKAGEEATLEATLSPSDAMFGTYSWSSSDANIATVDENGNVKAVGVGEATITATANNGMNAKCAVTVSPVVSIGDTVYNGTLLDALAEAEAGTVIKLIENITVEEISLKKCTLDLSGHALTVGYITADAEAYIIDSSPEKNGVLVVPKGNLLFISGQTMKMADEDNQVPIYSETAGGYVFAHITPQEKRNSEASADIFDLIFRPSLGTNDRNKMLLGGGREAAAIDIGIHLSWTVNGETKTEELVYGDDENGDCLVGKVYKEGMAFYIKASGVNSFKDLRITPYLKSDTGVICYGTEYDPNDYEFNVGVWDGEINQDWD